tara:strand:+ start:495 stop:962 length:468 start_codon:yes stop_codon:yes gene_type:complete
MICFIKYHIKFVLIISFIILLGCKLQDPLKTHGIIYLENRSKKVELKKSNKNDIIKIMGRPQIVNIEEGETWIYIERILTKGKYHKLGQHVLKQSNVLVLDFDKYGVLNKKEFFTKDDMNKVKFSKDETENVLTQKSFVQKFLQSIKSKMYSNKN